MNCGVCASDSEYPLCWTCQGKLRGFISDMRALIGELETQITRQSVGARSVGSSGTQEWRLPFDLDASRAADAIAYVFAYWYRPEKPKCLDSECESVSVARGFCMRHYTRRYRSGQLKSTKGVASGNPVSYDGAHCRVKAAFGPARNQSCIKCGNPARHWAYDGTDPEERFELQPWGNGSGNTKEVAYSHYPEFYMPMCVSCHTSMDRRNPSLKPPGARGSDFQDPRHFNHRGVEASIFQLSGPERTFWYANWHLTNYIHLSRLDTGPKMFRDFQKALENAEKAVDRKAAKVWLGECDCGRVIQSQPDEIAVLCVCGQLWHVEKVREAQRALGADQMVSAQDAQALGEAFGQQIKATTVITWARRGRLFCHVTGCIKGNYCRHIFRLGDILDLYELRQKNLEALSVVPPDV